MNKSGQLRTYFFSLFRVCVIISSALILPRFFLNERSSSSYVSSSNTIFKLGLENISAAFLKNLHSNYNFACRVGLITDHTGLDQSNKRNIEILKEKGLKITKIYVPATDKELPATICKKIDSATQIPIVTLPLFSIKNIFYEYAFDDIDVLFFDMQDMGIRPSKSLDLLCAILKSAAHQNKKIVILDRPNIFGNAIEGILANKNNPMIPSLPLQYGMTIGELARYINRELLQGAAHLLIVPMAHYDRLSFSDFEFMQKNFLLTNIDLGSGLCFLEFLQYISPLDVGIGTDMALQCLLLPESIRLTRKKWFELRSILKECGIESIFYHCFNPIKHQRFHGLRLSIKDFNQFSPFNTLLRITQFFKNTGISLAFHPEFDTVVGDKNVREFIQGIITTEELEQIVNKGLKNFVTKAQRAFIYKPYPKIIFL